MGTVGFDLSSPSGTRIDPLTGQTVRSTDAAARAADPARFTPFRGRAETTGITNFLLENLGIALGRVPEGVRGARRGTADFLGSFAPERRFSGGVINRTLDRIAGQTNINFFDPANPAVRAGDGGLSNIGGPSGIRGLTDADLEFIFFGGASRVGQGGTIAPIPTRVDAIGGDPNVLARLREVALDVDPDRVGLVNALITGRARNALDVFQSGGGGRRGQDLSATFTPDFVRAFADISTAGGGIGRRRSRDFRTLSEVTSIDPSSRDLLGRIAASPEGRIPADLRGEISAPSINFTEEFDRIGTSVANATAQQIGAVAERITARAIAGTEGEVGGNLADLFRSGGTNLGAQTATSILFRLGSLGGSAVRRGAAGSARLAENAAEIGFDPVAAALSSGQIGPISAFLQRAFQRAGQNTPGVRPTRREDVRLGEAFAGIDTGFTATFDRIAGLDQSRVGGIVDQLNRRANDLETALGPTVLQQTLDLPESLRTFDFVDQVDAALKRWCKSK